MGFKKDFIKETKVVDQEIYVNMCLNFKCIVIWNSSVKFIETLDKIILKWSLKN